MKRVFLLTLLAVGAAAQTPSTNPVIAENRQFYEKIKGYLTRAAASMPEQDYSFKPTPEMRTFGELLAHIADHQTQYCSMAMGKQQKGDAASKSSKADLQAALAASFTLCDSAWASLTDTNFTQMTGQRSKLGTLLLDILHSNEEYGYMSPYFRLKGLTPPSSDRSGR